MAQFFKMFIIAVLSAGISTNAFSEDASLERAQFYFTHDNGGRPFMVLVQKNQVDIYKKDQYKTYTAHVKTYKDLDRVFIGEFELETANPHGFVGTGNTVLLHVSDNRYVYIGEMVYEFETGSSSDRIESYYSFIGNNDVPYPVAVGTENVYFVSGFNSKYLSKEHFQDFSSEDWERDAYPRFWGETVDPNNSNLERNVKDINITNVVCERDC